MSASEPWPGEEPWERDVHELLASLPMVDPPEGFLQRAIDRRPKYAGRLTVLALTSVMAVTLALVGLGLVGDPAAVAPAVPSLAERHTEVAASVGPSLGGGQSGFERVDESAPVDLPARFEPQVSVRDGELIQVVYHHDGGMVSLFAQRGRVQWDRLPAEGRGELDGKPVWSDARRRVVIVEAGSYAVAVVGMDIDEAMDLLRHAQPHGVTAGDRFRSLAREVSRQAGFP